MCQHSSAGETVSRTGYNLSIPNTACSLCVSLPLCHSLSLSVCFSVYLYITEKIKEKQQVGFKEPQIFGTTAFLGGCYIDCQTDELHLPASEQPPVWIEVKERPGVTRGEINVEYVDLALIALTRQFRRLCRLAHSTFKTAGSDSTRLEQFSVNRPKLGSDSMRLEQFSVNRPKLRSVNTRLEQSSNIRPKIGSNSTRLEQFSVIRPKLGPDSTRLEQFSVTAETRVRQHEAWTVLSHTAETPRVRH